jgi:hypothetical protein
MIVGALAVIVATIVARRRRSGSQPDGLTHRAKSGSTSRRWKHRSRCFAWSGRRESNPHHQLGRLAERDFRNRR